MQLLFIQMYKILIFSHVFEGKKTPIARKLWYLFNMYGIALKWAKLQCGIKLKSVYVHVGITVPTCNDRAANCYSLVHLCVQFIFYLFIIKSSHCASFVIVHIFTIMIITISLLNHKRLWRSVLFLFSVLIIFFIFYIVSEMKMKHKSEKLINFVFFLILLFPTI